MAEDQIQNRAELEFTSRTNRESFRQTREEIRQEMQQTATTARQAATSVSTGGVSDSEREALRRDRADRDRERQERNAARVREVNQQRVVSDEEFRIMSRLNSARNRSNEDEIKGKQRVRDEVIKLAREKQQAEEGAYKSGARVNTQYSGIGAANFGLTGGYKSSLLARAGSEELDAFRDAQGAGGAGGGGRGGFYGGAGFNRFAGRRAIAEAGYLVGAPEIGQVASLASYGPTFAAIGGGIAAAGGLVESIKLYKEEQDELQKLTVILHNTDQSFVQISASAEIFASKLGLSRTESEKLAGSLAELNLKAGLDLGPQQAAQLSTIFSAHGLNPDEQAQALKLLSTNAADAFEKLTGLRADVTIDNYARSLGTTTDKLTDMQKQQILVNELLRRSGEYTQEAALRMQSFGGQWDRLVSTMKDVGGTVGQQALLALRSIILLSPATQVLEGISGNQLTGQKTFGDRFRDIFGGYAYRTQAAGYDAQAAAENRRVREQQDGREREKQQAIADAQQRAAIQYNDYFSGRQRNNVLEGRYSASSQFKSLQQQQDLFERNKGALSTSDAAKYTDQFTDVKSEQVEAARQKIIAFSKTFRDSFDDLAQLSLPGDKANPYVKIFADGELAAARAQEKFALAGDEVVNQIVKAQRAMQDAEVYELRLKDNLSAVKLEFEAASLAKPFIELTGEMKRTLSIFQTDLKTLSGPGLLFAARQIESGGAARFQNVPGPLQGLPGLELQQLNSLRRRYIAEPGRGGDEIQHLLNQQYISLYQRLSPQERQSVFRQGETRFRFSEAYRGEERYGRDQVELSIQRAEASRSTIKEAQAQLTELQKQSRRAGADPNITRATFLAITGTLPREELTPDLIKGRTAALQEEARFVRGREERARKAIEATEKFQNQVLTNLQELLRSVQTRSDSVLVEVLDRTDTAKISTLGQSYTPGSADAQPSPNDLARQIQGLR